MLESTDIDRLHQKATHGFTPTVTEWRHVMELLTGKPCFARKRCDVCNGEGRIPDRWGTLRWPCQACDGEGYQ